MARIKTRFITAADLMLQLARAHRKDQFKKDKCKQSHFRVPAFQMWPELLSRSFSISDLFHRLDDLIGFQDHFDQPHLFLI